MNSGESGDPTKIITGRLEATTDCCTSAKETAVSTLLTDEVNRLATVSESATQFSVPPTLSSVFIYEDISQDGQELLDPKPSSAPKCESLNFSILNSEPIDSTAPQPCSAVGATSTRETCNSAESTINETTSLNKRKHSGRDITMEHSGLCENEPRAKRPNVCERLGALCCLAMQGVDKDSPPTKVARELCRCLNEPKYQLMCDAIHYLGTGKVLKLFEETSNIQENGGQLTADGKIRRTPGGVFFSLIKQAASPEVKAKIFQTDKRITAKSKKLQRRLEKQHMLNSRQKDLKKAHEKWKTQVPPLLPRVEKNIHKRFPTDLLAYNSTSMNGISDTTSYPQVKETMDRDGKALDDDDGKAPSEVMEKAGEEERMVTEVVGCDGPSSGSAAVPVDALAIENEAAEEFERTTDLDFGFEIA